MDSPEAIGPKGGIRVGVKGLGKVYLRESDLLGLIQSGYVGTHGRETEAITPLIQAVAKGNRGGVIAWQHLLKKLPIP